MSEIIQSVKISALPPTNVVFANADIPLSQNGETFKAAPNAFPFNRVFVGATAPTAQRTNDLWVDTSGAQPNPKYWSGSSWVSWQNTDTSTALGVANAKNRIFTSTGLSPAFPSNPTDGIPLNTGDLYIWDSTLDTLASTLTGGGVWVWNGIAWGQFPVKVGPNDILSIILGDVTTRYALVAYNNTVPFGAYPDVNSVPIQVYSVDGKLYRWDQTITAWTARVDGADIYGTVGGATYP